MINPFVKRRTARKQEAAPTPINVHHLIARHSIEEFNEAAENYFQRNANNTAYYLKQPLGQAVEASQQLIFFAEMLSGLKPLPGMKLLDFGAASGWTSRYLADFKLQIVACDVSPTALALAKQIFSRNPVIDSPFEPEFMIFNGRRLEMPAESVDRISCFDSFHRVSNPQQILREFARVLKSGGIAAISGPGPKHSKTPQSQAEMKNHLLIQNDTVLDEIWPWAQEAGFTDIRVAVVNASPFSLSLSEFNTLTRKKGTTPLQAYAEHVRRRSADRRVFFLYKGEPTQPDSRDRTGLSSAINVELNSAQVSAQGWVEGIATAFNSGKAKWLPSDALFGPVKLGVHLKSSDGELLDYDFARADLPPDRSVAPGETVEIPFRIMAPANCGDYVLEFDMVSEGVCWFEANGATTSYAILKVE